MPETQTPFKWDDYIHLEIGDPDFKALVTASLDQISETPEGQDVIRKGYDNLVAQSKSELGKLLAAQPALSTYAPRPDHKIDIRDRARPNALLLNSGSQDAPISGTILLNKFQVGHIGFTKPDGTWQPMNLTHILYHELFHQADPHLQEAERTKNKPAEQLFFKKYLKELIQVKDSPGEEADTLRQKIYQTWFNLSLEKDFPELKGMSDTDRTAWFKQHPESITTIARKAHKLADASSLNESKDEIAKRLSIDPASISFQDVDMKKILAEGIPGIDPRTHAPIVEELATRATDWFMGKYFDETPRDYYMRTQILPKDAVRPPEVYPFKCGAPQELVYMNADPSLIDKLPKPSPTPCEDVVRKAQQTHP